jgi:hypothetical protein
MLLLPARDLARVDAMLLCKLHNGPVAQNGSKRHLRLESGEWFRQVRFVIVAPDAHTHPCALSGTDATYRHRPNL